MVKLSERLRTAASLISSGSVLADVGTDHGYVPVYLLEQRRIPRAIALDINRGPLARAKEHIALYGMGDYIETRLSDGVAALSPGEADSILIAGMGGGLIMHILEAGEAVCRSAAELVLQPQSELARVRRFLDNSGYVTEAEELVKEDGKYYPMMRVHYGGEKSGKPPEEQEVYRLYGELLLKERHPVLPGYLEKERLVQEDIYRKLKAQPQTEQIGQRIREVEHRLEQNEKARAYYGEESLKGQ